MKKSLRCICAAIFALAFCTGFVIHASAVERASLYLTRYSATAVSYTHLRAHET